jgi:hypothetical protein
VISKWLQDIDMDVALLIHLTTAKHIYKEKSTLSLERLFHKGYDRKGSVKRTNIWP